MLALTLIRGRAPIESRSAAAGDGSVETLFCPTCGHHGLHQKVKFLSPGNDSNKI